MAITFASLAGTAHTAARQQSPNSVARPDKEAQSADSANPHFKRDPKKAKEAYREGADSEQKQDWAAAYASYSRAVDWDPENHDYLMRRQLAKGRLIQADVDLAEKEAVSGELGKARKELLDAHYLDPSDETIRDRLAELSALEPSNTEEKPQGIQLESEIHLDYHSGERNFNFRGDTQGLYEEIARQFGVNAAFDADLHAQQTRFQVNHVDFVTAMELAGDATHTFWYPLTKHLFFIADNTVQKRRQYEPLLVRTIRLPASETPEQVTELSRLVRDVTGILRVEQDPANRTITLRASARAMAVASDLIENLEKPAGELVLEMEILEVDRAYARQIGITPPQTGKIYTLDSGLLGSGNSEANIISTLEQIFGTPSALSGLTPDQIATQIAEGTLDINSLLPPVVAFGGGATTFFSTLPGVTANLGRTLALVRSGRRVLLRAEDGQPASFFVGERYPVSLAQYSSSLVSNVSTSPATSQNFPVSALDTGNAPAFVTGAVLRKNSIEDLIVANQSDNTVSVFLGNGDGTFASPVTYPTGQGPVWIATGDFDNDGNLDLAVADKSANTVSVLLGNGDGTFKPKVDYATGSVPVSVVAADFNGDGNLDLAVANQADNSISLLFGNGIGGFSTIAGIPNVLAAGHAPTALTTGHFTTATSSNGSSIMDLAVANQNDNSVSIFLGNGNGTFQTRTDYATGAAPVYVATGDFNGDAITDLAIANNKDNTVSILVGQAGSTGAANGTFGGRVDYEAGTGPSSIAVADYNLDGIEDLAVADSGGNAIALLFGLTGGTFNVPFVLNAGNDPLSIFTADFDGNGTPDAAIANNASNTVSVILNNSTSSPGLGSPGTQFPYSEYIDLGLKIKATPRLHRNGDVTLQLHFDLTGLAGASFNAIPVLTNDSLEQTVRLKENETTLLAGILQPSVSTALNGTPGLAEVPGLGALAGNKNVAENDTQLLILITPRMVQFAPRKSITIYAGHGEGGGLGGYISPFQRRFPQPQPLPGNNQNPIKQPQP
ncbi:MAG TPA: FG-GAP-like repeat-containing protein [Candidatus Acidoferrales bacterium]|nr:FG-GAP-like repeat-containing protein [Candidatus Acidoferrales bacterium]